MRFEEFNRLIEELSYKEEYEVVDAILNHKIDEIVKLESYEVGKYLELYASLAGDAESLERFDQLFSQLVLLGKVKENELNKYEELSPAKRWL